jgi:hypothetical protein
LYSPNTPRNWYATEHLFLTRPLFMNTYERHTFFGLSFSVVRNPTYAIECAQRVHCAKERTFRWHESTRIPES